MAPPAKRLLTKLPKAELHIHLEGAIRFDTLAELSQKYKLQIPPDTRNKRFADFGNFIETYITACECLREESDLFRLVLEVAEDAAASGATWIEPALSTSLYEKRFGGMVPALQVLMRAAEAAETATGIGIGFIVACERHFPVEQADALAALVREQVLAKSMTIHGKPGIVGFGLHGSEGGFPPGPFINAFKTACTGTGLVSVPHAGEIAPSVGEGAKSVLDACVELKARRIGHGVLALEDDQVIKYIVENNVCLDVCITSNHMLSVVPSVKEHPLPKLLSLGVTCTINSDDPLLFGSNLGLEYELCRTQLGLSDEAIAACAMSSFEFSCAPEELKQQNIQAIKQWLND